VAISASIGISAVHGEAGLRRGADALLADADQAMYGAKQGGKDGIVLSKQARWGDSVVAASAAAR
jgi:PleD family two-component response regulator